MTADEMDSSAGEFERRARALLESSAEGISARLRSRLTRARYAALEAAGKRRRSPWRSWAPAGAMAAAVLASLIAFQQHRGISTIAVNPESNTALEDMELLSDSDALDLAQEQDTDYDFYEWAAGEDGGPAPSSVGT